MSTPYGSKSVCKMDYNKTCHFIYSIDASCISYLERSTARYYLYCACTTIFFLNVH